MRVIDTYIHRCVITSGDMEGSTNIVKVTHLDFEHFNHCEECGQPLATTEQMIAHIYSELSS